MLISLTAVVALSSCQTIDPRPYTPTRVHPDGVGIEYKIVKAKKNKCTDPDFAVMPNNPTKIINNMSGYVCLPPHQYQKLYTEYLTEIRNNCPSDER